jgi:nucleotide-binding universal stress UspA family protein
MNGPIRKVLVYVDGTEESVTAAHYAVLLCRSTGAELSAAYVVNTRALTDLVKTRIFLQSEQQEYQRDIEADADRYLNHIREIAHQKGVAIDTVKGSGTPNQEIRRIVEEKDIDLLVIGEISQVRSRRDEFYNETERAMRRVNCSVLVVKDEDRVWSLFESS